MEFGAGEGGELSAFFTFIPAWLHLETDSQFQKYFEVLNDAFRKDNFLPIVGAFRNADWSDRFMAEFIKQTQSLVKNKNLIEIANKLSYIYLKNITVYRRVVWKQAQEELKQRVLKLNQHFQKTDYIYNWEQFLGIPFASKQYEVVLCYANKNGPNHNSLGYSSNLFYYNEPFEQTLQFLSHEIGTHLLIDVYFKLAAKGIFEHSRLYSAYETMAMFYNKLILDMDKLDYSLPQMNDTGYLDKYANIYYDDINPETLLLKVLET